MKLVITTDTWGDVRVLRIYDDWTLKDVLKNECFIYDEGENNYSEKFIKFYDAPNRSIVDIENITYIDTNNFKPNERFYSPEYYKSDPLNKFKMFGRKLNLENKSIKL